MFAKIQNALCLSKAAREWLPPSRTGKPAHPSVLTRWNKIGILVNGRRVYLETWKLGGQRVTTQEAVEKFLVALNEDHPGQQTQEIDDTTRRGREASKALEELGA